MAAHSRVPPSSPPAASAAPDPAAGARSEAADRSVSIVVAVFNAEATLERLVEQVVVALEDEALPFEILLVNDGSRDGSWERIAALAEREPRIRGLDLMRNFGQHNALLAGIRAARRARIVTLDDDLQHPPEAIPRLLAALDAGADVAYGTPEERPHSVARRLASGGMHLLLHRVLGSEVSHFSSPFRAFRTPVREAFSDYEAPFVTIDALLTWGSRSFHSVPVAHAPRRAGGSNYTLLGLLQHAFHTITNFSVRPLQFASVLGFAFTLLGFAAMVYAVGFYKLQGMNVPPDTFIFAVVCLFSGIQLFTLGIIGEYLARVHVRTLGRPPYVVRRRTDEGS